MYIVQLQGYKSEEDWTEDTFNSFVELEYLKKCYRKYLDKLKSNWLKEV
jgi:hypothetical protein